MTQRRYDGVVLDLDGTVYLGGTPIAGAAEALARLQGQGVRVAYVTNNPLASPERYAARLQDMGIEAGSEQILTSGLVLRDWLIEHQLHSGVYLVAEEPLTELLAGSGIRLVDDAEQAETVVVSFDRTFDYAKWRTAHQALLNGARFIASNPDVSCPTPYSTIPDCGGVIAALEATTRRRVQHVIGKPSETMMAAALQMLELPAERVLVVGDRLETDVLMGQRAGVHSALVLSGVTGPEQLEHSEIQPHWVLPSIAGLDTILGIDNVGEAVYV